MCVYVLAECVNEINMELKWASNDENRKKHTTNQKELVESISQATTKLHLSKRTKIFGERERERGNNSNNNTNYDKIGTNSFTHSNVNDMRV